MSVFILKDICVPAVCEREALRYAGVLHEDTASLALLRECVCGCEEIFAPALCYTELDLKIDGDTLDFGVFSVKSRSLAGSLGSASRVILFCATAGIGFDRAMTKYSRIHPAKALMLSSLGSERIEALCDIFIKEYEEKMRVKTTPRFSAGYGDLPISLQREIFSVLNPEKNIGVTLNESLFMTPTKSVTAFAGII